MRASKSMISKKEVTIRSAVVSDIKYIVPLHASSWRENFMHSLSPEFLNNARVFDDRIAFWNQRLGEEGVLNNKQCDLLAELNNEFAGFISIDLNKKMIAELF